MHKLFIKHLRFIEKLINKFKWSPDGYFYPIQIAQYALVAYTKNITSTTKTVRNLMEPENGRNCNWLGSQIDFIGSCQLTVNEPKLVKLQFVSQFLLALFFIVSLTILSDQNQSL